MNSASWAVTKTSAAPPARAASPAPRAPAWRPRSCSTASSAWPPPPTIAITRSPSEKRCAPGPSPTTSPASSRPGMSCGRAGRRRIAALALQHVGAVEAGGLHGDQHLSRSGSGIGWSSTLRAPSLIVTARIYGPWPAKCSFQPTLAVRRAPAAHGLPQLHDPPLWRESRMGLELAALARNPVFRGEGVTDGRGQPVLLIPGFMAGDASLGIMARWLKGTGHHPSRAGIRSNVALLGRHHRGARGPPRAPGRPPGQPRGHRRPQPRRQLRQGAGPPPARPRVRAS